MSEKYMETRLYAVGKLTEISQKVIGLSEKPEESGRKIIEDISKLLDEIIRISYKLEMITDKHQEDYIDYKEFVEGFMGLPKKLMTIGDKYEKDFKKLSEDFLEVSGKLIELEKDIMKSF